MNDWLFLANFYCLIIKILIIIKDFYLFLIFLILKLVILILLFSMKFTLSYIIIVEIKFYFIDENNIAILIKKSFLNN